MAVPLYEHDRSIWDGCASDYERQIVRGHPDVTAYESFEHSFIERLALFLTGDCGRDLHVYDFGCGSGRIHQLLAPLIERTVPETDGAKASGRSGGTVRHVGGIDFSENMIELARRNLDEEGFGMLYPGRLSFDVGSAFDVLPYLADAMPLAVSVCNSIGVMQGPEGARRLFSSMGRYVRSRKGIAVISCYRREAVAGYALGNYESTMDVCGQPGWLAPDTYAGRQYTLVPHSYKRAHDPDPRITVDVFSAAGDCVKRDHELVRDAAAVRKTIATGNIRTFNGYRSQWYAMNRIKEWMREFWGDGMLWHIPGSRLDRLRGEPAQLAIVDYSGAFGLLAKQWKLRPLSAGESERV